MCGIALTACMYVTHVYYLNHGDWFVPYAVYICRERVQRSARFLIALDPSKFQGGTENQLIQSKLCMKLTTSYAYICMYTYIIVCVHVCMHAQVCACACVHVCVCVGVCVCVCACFRACIRVCVCVCDQ